MHKYYRNKDGEFYNASSVKAMYTNLCRFLSINYEINIKHSSFDNVRKIIKRKQEESSANGLVPGAHASKPMDKKDLAKLIDKGLMSINTPKGLLTLLIVKLQTGFGLRGGKELHDIYMKDISIHSTDGKVDYIELIQRVTKTRRELHANFNMDERPRICPDESNCLCPVKAMEIYISKRPEEMNKENAPLFLNPITVLTNASPLVASQKSIWYSKQRMGINTIATLLKTQLNKAGVNTSKISNTSLRKLMVSDTLNNAAPAAYVSNLAVHANLESKKSYAVPNSVVEKTMARMVNNSTSNKTETFEEAMNAIKKAEKKQEEKKQNAGDDNETKETKLAEKSAEYKQEEQKSKNSEDENKEKRHDAFFQNGQFPNMTGILFNSKSNELLNSPI